MNSMKYIFSDKFMKISYDKTYKNYENLIVNYLFLLFK